MGIEITKETRVKQSSILSTHRSVFGLNGYGAYHKYSCIFVHGVASIIYITQYFVYDLSVVFRVISIHISMCDW